ncbi:hypothetical protein M378DRAFT_966347 [Amanita muscaria Koide BX008]|uniref:Nephrocystin 3-like N-terminal domain-containing protein n=1 Tax=Amanita muscaria (strain Koide BX008) TaxID=946122 RepID=A0A0C2WT11_AMAMK|nr:hypothetical protein M378DRAFT_966347 [Amanita muscaria Koide BX008]
MWRIPMAGTMRFQGWIDDITSPERIFWLNGSSGSGKSAIARTIADSNGKDKVVAAFFFCRSDPERNNGNRLFITLAWQLALSIPFLKSHIIQSLNRDPGLPWKSVETQFKELIAQPFQEIVIDAASKERLPSLVVIIDGIDECSDEKLQRRILGIIGDAASNVHVPLRFLISSRLEAHIKSAFDQVKCPMLCIDLRLERLEELVSFEAIHNSRAQGLARRWNSSSCTDDSKQLQGWVDNRNTMERICWLHGPASSGKSAIAQSIADLNERGKVTATFFFHRSDATRNDGTRLFPTLCWQFASSISTYKDYIIQYLAEGPKDLSSQNVQHQFEQLVVKPFEALKAVGSQEQPLDYIAIIDGVDECADLKIQREFFRVIIGNAVKSQHVPLRFLIVSRSEGPIQEAIDFFQCPVLSVVLGMVPSGTGTSAKLHYNLRIAPAKDCDGSLLEPAMALTLPAKYDSWHSWHPLQGYSQGSGQGSSHSLLDFEDGMHADINKYLKAEFSRIAARQGLAKTWPGQHVVQDLAHRSSGHFIYASTIVKLFGRVHKHHSPIWMHYIVRF